MNLGNSGSDTKGRIEIRVSAASGGDKNSSQAAHDLRNVLTGMIGHLSLLRDHPSLPPDVAESLAVIEKAAVRARNMSLQLGGYGESPEGIDEPQPKAQPKPAQAIPQKKPNSAGRVLAMDDEPGIRALLSAALAHFGYEVTTVPDGADAVREYQRALVAKEPYAAVIMDLTVPGGMGGKEAVQALRALDPGVKAIISSGHSADPAIVDFRAHGFVARVDKPYRIQELGAIVQQATRN